MLALTLSLRTAQSSAGEKETARRLLILVVVAAAVAAAGLLYPRALHATRAHPVVHPTRKSGIHRAALPRPGRATKRTSHRRLTAADTVLAYPTPPVRARASFLMDLKTGKVLFAHNADARLPIASTTKITTAILTLQHARLTDLATVSQKAEDIGESTMVLKRGERLRVIDLLYGLMLNSANDAAIALAEHVAGSESRFVRMMNALARRLGMSNTHYVTSHGLDTPGHYSSARDLAAIARYAMRNRVFRRIVATQGYHIPATRHNAEHWLANINRVMFWMPGVDGVKPGQTDASGLCQVVSAWRNGRHLLAVLLNTPTLVFDMRNLLDYGSRDFQWVAAPAYWDTPDRAFAGRSGIQSWEYFVGAGHYVRGLFRMYFDTHGGPRTLGYPRTEPLRQRGKLVQYFQAAELAYDPAHRSVYPVDVGMRLARRLHVHRAAGAAVNGQLAVYYHLMGGEKVFGRPVTRLVSLRGIPVQFFEYGVLTAPGGVPAILPAGDALLRLKGWLPAAGASDVYAPTMSAGVLNGFGPPRPPAR